MDPSSTAPRVAARVQLLAALASVSILEAFGQADAGDRDALRARLAQSCAGVTPADVQAFRTWCDRVLREWLPGAAPPAPEGDQAHALEALAEDGLPLLYQHDASTPIGHLVDLRIEGDTIHGRMKSAPNATARELAATLPRARCLHGVAHGECQACLIGSDLAYDAARERGAFGR